ncbi:MAG: hypothetical protein PHF29_07580 [Candidatus Riflebacteria bacterium]|nr:hypothetical protein [Candidatus Riflebacteria bacterium]
MNMQSNFDFCDFAVTICDTDAIIIYMNEKACKTFEKFGGKSLIGKSLFECHKQASIETIKKMIKNKETNSYTILKNGEKKLIHQAPWYKDGKIAGLVELSIVIPENMPHFIR